MILNLNLNLKYTFKFKITPNRHNAIQNLIYSLLHDPPLFSLPSTFKHAAKKVRHGAGNYCKTGFMYRPPTERHGEGQIV
jgi:hypothetical protein